MTTIKACQDYGRDVLAVPGDVRSELSTGPHQLLRDGAALCANAGDVLEALAQRLGEAGMSRFGLLESKILDALKTRPANPDGLTRLLGEDPLTVARALGRLELGGAVERELGGYRRT